MLVPILTRGAKTGGSYSGGSTLMETPPRNTCLTVRVCWRTSSDVFDGIKGGLYVH